MRLIDADELITEILTHDLIGDDKEVDKIILDAPTVEAIPIDWIVKRINYYSDLILTYPNEKEILYSQTELISLLEDWEKENAEN